MTEFAKFDITSGFWKGIVGMRYFLCSNIFQHFVGGNGPNPLYSGLVQADGLWCTLAGRHFVKRFNSQ